MFKASSPYLQSAELESEKNSRPRLKKTSQFNAKSLKQVNEFKFIQGVKI